MQTFIKNISYSVYDEYIKSIKEKDYFTLVLSGGNTPQFIFEELVKNYLEKINWKKVHIFWLDERCVLPTDKDSNFKLAKEYLLDFIDSGSIHRMQGEIEADESALLYEKEIKNFFKSKGIKTPIFDLILLGMGTDGHCASLFPDSIELKEHNRLVISTNKEYNGNKRITLTLPIINRSNKVLMIGSKEKLNVFNAIKKDLPIHLVNKKNMKVIIRNDEN